jgi:hypothetical protein
LPIVLPATIHDNPPNSSTNHQRIHERIRDEINEIRTFVISFGAMDASNPPAPSPADSHDSSERPADVPDQPEPPKKTGGAVKKSSRVDFVDTRAAIASFSATERSTDFVPSPHGPR